MNPNWNKDNAHWAWHRFNTRTIVNIKYFWDKNTQWFHVEVLQIDDATRERIHDGQKFFVMKLIVNLDKRKFMKTKTNWMKKIIYSKLWEYNT